MTVVLSYSRGYGKVRLSRGIEAILRAREDALAGRLICPCDECEARREAERASDQP